jgi:hypothetical protein
MNDKLLPIKERISMHEDNSLNVSKEIKSLNIKLE